ncbi:sigma factor-like helix-turn-helix DNA-binding protein [Paenarthrobacter sp. NPDC092416]|uniref:sigma factor-like helix-turn-helix DNA-binding protein n=1 Tax=Paenarthrobacter sp. NPDC092416 TaxID=3364386 RepID=UPI00382ECDF2
MCEIPKRRWRSSITPLRLVVTVIAVGAIAVGWLLPDLLSALPVGAGLLTLAVAVLMPAVREIEFGLSPNIKLSPALKDRQAELRSVFEQQKGYLEYCAHLLCEDPETAQQLLEAAWSQATTDWKGPVTPQLRMYTLCVFVQLLKQHERWFPPPPRKRGKLGQNPLAALPLEERTAVVLHEFANLTVAEIAGMTEQAVTAVGKALAHAESTTARFSLEKGKP